MNSLLRVSNEFAPSRYLETELTENVSMLDEGEGLGTEHQ